jgi:transcription elongation factor GreA-like protein
VVKKPAKKKKAGKVHVGMQSMQKLAAAAHKAGHGEAFEKLMGKHKETVFVQMNHTKFDKLKTFVKSKPELAKHSVARSLSACDCKDDDPFCFCFENN